MSIKTRLFIFSMLFCFVGLILIGGYSYFLAKEALLNRTFNQLTSVREEKGRQVEQFFRDRKREIEFISNHTDIMSAVDAFNKSKDLKYYDFRESSSALPLLDFITSAESYSNFGIGLGDGRVFCLGLDDNGSIDYYISSGSESGNLFKNLFSSVLRAQGPVITDFVKGSLPNTYSIYVAAPVYLVERSMYGMVFLEIPEIILNKLMAERLAEIKLGVTGEVYLVGDDFLMRSSSRFLENSVLNVKCNTEAVKKALKGQADVAKILDYRGVKVLSSFSPLSLSHANWVVVSEMDWNEALHDTTSLGSRIIIIGIAVFVLITIGVFLFSWRVTNPIYKLKEAAKRVGDGKFDQMLAVEHRDEIGLLTQVFNKMTLRLKHTTQRLREREQRLLHFYKATVDGIILHKDGKPILVNRALANLTGYSETELLNKSTKCLFPEANPTVQKDGSKEVDSFESILINKEGKRFPVEVQYRRMVYLDQEVETLVIRDISERKEIEDELKEERQHRLRSVIDGQEQERQRLSRELHDGLGQTLVAIKLRLESIPLDGLGRQKDTIEMVKRMFNQTIEETRRISNNLMPAALTEFSLAVVLRNLCNEVESNSDIPISLVVGVLPDSLDMLTKTYAYRIAQEALNNIMKHSNASRGTVSIFSDIKKLYLQVEDNGDGFEQKKLNSIGNGLYNMKERAVILGGKFDIVSNTGKGTKILVEFPIKSN